MVQAELVIWVVILDVNVLMFVCAIGLFVEYGWMVQLVDVVDCWLDVNVEGIVCVIGVEIFAFWLCVCLFILELVKGLEFDFVVFVDLDVFGVGVDVLFVIVCELCLNLNVDIVF